MIDNNLKEEMALIYFSKIQSFIIDSCTELVKEFKQHSRTIPNDENKIRNVLVEEYLENDNYKKKNSMEDYRFIPEVPENYDNETYTYAGRVDIKILLGNDFTESSDYFIVECKRLDGKSTLNNLFVTEGVNRFTGSKYKSLLNYSTMLGFVITSNEQIINIYNKIIKIQESNECYSDVIGNVEVNSKYLSVLRKFKDSGFNIKYILSDFSEIIKSS